MDKRLQALVFGIDIVDAELENDSVIVSRHCGTSPEKVHRLKVVDRQRHQGEQWHNEFSKDGREAFHYRAIFGRTNGQ
ncbi:hypothetical protein FHS18_006958 [Paenibacillus phyllosphaerae]|uniref:Uncharacterized protein n=1 Tax=Paenibacillus phyllosphaerae TaxID=274593 RepID=A0A7W5B5S8_9BACL|nr:hypothetical protein [Paenibacillus phyllosphaerae]